MPLRWEHLSQCGIKMVVQGVNMRSLVTIAAFKYWIAVANVLQAWSKALDSALQAADDSANARPGQNGRLFGYRPIQKHRRNRSAIGRTAVPD